jgi:hypothetical protein
MAFFLEIDERRESGLKTIFGYVRPFSATSPIFDEKWLFTICKECYGPICAKISSILKNANFLAIIF